MIITASGGMRGSKRIELKQIADAAAKAAADQGHKVSPVMFAYWAPGIHLNARCEVSRQVASHLSVC